VTGYMVMDGTLRGWRRDTPATAFVRRRAWWPFSSPCPLSSQSTPGHLDLCQVFVEAQHDDGRLPGWQRREQSHSVSSSPRRRAWQATSGTADDQPRPP
jgi:ribosomal protein L39E